MGGHKLLIFVHTALLTYGILLCICSFADATITDFLCRSTQSEPLINPKREILHNHYHDLLLSRLRRWIQPQRSLTKSSASNISRIWLAILGGDCIGTLLSNDLIITTAKCATKYADQHQHQHLPLSQAIIPKILVLHGSQMSLNEQSTNRIVDSIYVHPRGIDIAYIRLKKQHLEQKETGNAIYRTQSDSKLSILSPMRLTVNSNTMLPRPDGMARAVVIDDTHTDALLTNSNTEQTVTTTLRTSDFPVVPTSKCHTNESDLESSPVTDESYLCLLNNDAHSYCKVQLRYDR